MNHLATRRQGRIATLGAWALVSFAVGGLGCHHRHRDARAPQGDTVVMAPADTAPAAVPEAGPSSSMPAPEGSGSGSGSGSASASAVDASPATVPPPGPPPSDPPRRSTKEKAQDIGVAVSTGVGALLNTVATKVPRTEVHAGASMSVSTQCYDHDCNGARTGRKCFGDHASYCASLCRESNCVSRTACQSECR